MNSDRKYNKYSNIILTIIAMIGIVLSVTATSFAYYLIKIQKNDKENLMSFGILSFDRDNLIEYSTLSTNKNEINFTLSTSSNMKNTKINYNVYFNVIENNINSENIVYLTNGESGVNSNDITIKYGNELDEYKKQINISDKDISVGYIPSDKINKILIGKGEIGNYSSDKWNFKIWLNDEYSYSSIQEIKGYISIETE